MKTKHVLALLTVSIVFLFISCSDSDDKGGGGATKTDNQAINEWIYGDMSQYYFWENEMPKSTSLNFNDEPNDFFFKTIFNYKLPGGDRFSYLEKDGVRYTVKEQAKSKKRSNEIGFEYYTVGIQNSNYIAYVVVYVMKDTDAEKKLKRGDIIIKLNDEFINNGTDPLQSGKTSFKLELADKSEVSLNTTKDYYENPLFLSKILPAAEVGGRKVAYILYNFFANDKGDDSNAYALEINKVLQSYKDQNIDELILDLRYNGGGYVSSGTYIASAIAPNRSGKIYTRRKYNSKLDNREPYKSNKNNYFENNITVERNSTPIPELGMKKIYVITSRYTASASEQIINGLRTYLDVRIVGEKTIGKNMESFSLEDKKNKANTWILHPLTSISYSSVDEYDYSSGFQPTHPSKGMETSEFPAVIEQGALAPLGDTRELLLAKVIEDITGKRASPSPRTLSKSLFSAPIGSSLAGKSNAMIIEQE